MHPFVIPRSDQPLLLTCPMHDEQNFDPSRHWLIIDQIATDNMAAHFAEPLGSNSLSDVWLSGEQIANGLDLVQPAKGRGQVVLGNILDDSPEALNDLGRFDYFGQQVLLGAFPEAASRASWRRFVQSAGVMGCDRPASDEAIACSTRSMCSSGTNGSCSFFSRRAATAASRAASFEGNSPPATMLARYCSVC